MNVNDIPKQLTEFYYSALSREKGQLGNIYRTDSALTWEGTKHEGVAAIMEQHMRFAEGVQFNTVTRDFQICGDKMVVLVTGQLITEAGANPVHFSQAFTLAADGAGGFYVLNDLFRLNYG
ncbi:nuclear transport factor 2 [Rhizoctonia solani]|uniref:Nuclear transport factor 2 n=1 Tax=Rhizoctonia solani TaxID=456999 RepID=A0A8H8P7Q7_9AGAM|nr:nuclear transport factor 2 [Rhizoctonia solani]QRW27079.1 nuclear transport factor 2 [Rhizoctonia solani]